MFSRPLPLQISIAFFTCGLHFLANVDKHFNPEFFSPPCVPKIASLTKSASGYPLQISPILVTIFLQSVPIFILRWVDRILINIRGCNIPFPRFGAGLSYWYCFSGRTLLPSKFTACFAVFVRAIANIRWFVSLA